MRIADRRRFLHAAGLAIRVGIQTSNVHLTPRRDRRCRRLSVLPELADRRVPPLDETEPAQRPVTVQDLLTMRMGFGWVLESDCPAVGLDALLTDRLFAALGMTETGFVADPPRLAPAFVRTEDGLVPFDGVADSRWAASPTFPDGRGGLVSTTRGCIGCPTTPRPSDRPAASGREPWS
ncbi:MAG: hypothetical protein GEU74_14775 [Nitriliruptorales bacterium]|nr:hypothetical protein [Nitriliruptorales bacterium]